MKLIQATNALVTIQARNAADFEAARAVAAKMEANTQGDLVRVAECEYELWIQLSARWDNKQAANFKDEYEIAKKECK